MEARDAIEAGREFPLPRDAGEPDFGNLLAVLRREKPARPTLFEFFRNPRIDARLAGYPLIASGPDANTQRFMIDSFCRCGYDYATLSVPGFAFDYGQVEKARTRSLNQGNPITDRESFRKYTWPDPEAADLTSLDRAASHLRPGMKIVAMGPAGTLEGVVRLVGYDRLCYLLADDEGLAGDLFEAVGSRLVRYYERVAAHPTVGALISNDDWGFKSQTMLSPRDMRRFVFPWHKRIVEVVHAAGKPAILHSCGNLESVMDDVIEYMGFDGKHSFEDVILPVEQAYDKYGGRIAILGGIDVDYLCHAAPEQIYRRSQAMLRRAEKRGGYALGSGNSIPDYVPDQGFLAMVWAALEDRTPVGGRSSATRFGGSASQN
jgi:uroporphyrinogen decarboxylase